MCLRSRGKSVRAVNNRISNLSVFIITKNEEAHIDACIKSASFAAEVVVVDSGSIDRTVEIAGNLGAKVIVHPFRDFSSQKNFALKQTQYEWVFSLDADERITPELENAIREIVRTGKSDGYRIKRVSYIFNRRFVYSGTQYDYPLRLFRRRLGVFEQAIHEVVQVHGGVGRINQPIIHHTFNNAHDYLRRLNLYTGLEVKESLLSGKKYQAVLAKGAARFADIYFRKLGIFDSVEGFVFSVLSAWYEMVKQFKIWEAQQLDVDR